MKDFSVALQLYSVRDDMEKDFAGTLQKVKSFGYEGVEFAGLFGRSAAEVKKMCADAGLVPISAHVSFDQMVQDNDLLKVYRDIGCKFVAIPSMSRESVPGTAKFAADIENMKLLGKKAKELGMQLCYHNHDFELRKYDGRYQLDHIFSDVPADLLQTEIDTCWVNVGGEDPAAYLRKYAGRAPIVHLKDFAGKKCENMYALIGVDEGRKKEASGEFQYRPLGHGLQNVPSLLAAAKDAGAKWVVVEQDQPSLGKSALECVQMSMDYLNSLD